MKEVKRHIILFIVLISGVLYFSCGEAPQGKDDTTANKEAADCADAEGDMEYEEELKEEVTDAELVTEEVATEHVEEEAVFSKSELLAFEERAVQKVQDLVSYIEIISDTTIDTYLREQTMEISLEFFMPELRVFAETVIQRFIKSGLKLNEKILSDVSIIQSLDKSENNVYQGAIGFTSSLNDTGEPSTEKKINYRLEFSLTEIEKQFGDEIEIVWEVQLGSLKKIN